MRRCRQLFGCMLLAITCTNSPAADGDRTTLREIVGDDKIQRVTLKMTALWNFGDKPTFGATLSNDDSITLLKMLGDLQEVADDKFDYPTVIDFTVEAAGRKPVRVTIQWRLSKAPLLIDIDGKRYGPSVKEKLDRDPVIELYDTLFSLFEKKLELQDRS
jgi:hypothetical protein